MLAENMFNARIFRAVLSGPTKTAAHERVEITRSGEKYQAAAYTAKQVFHSNFDERGVRDFLAARFGAEFSHYTAWDGEFEYSARATKKGKVLASRRKFAAAAPPESEAGFNRQKNHIIREGEDIPVLVDMGVFTRELKVAAPMRDKFRQINRFLELLADETAALPPETVINIIDFGCGKSYLTFVVYHYFARMKGRRVSICGIDSNAELIEKCAAAAKKYGYDSLHFQVGNIADFSGSAHNGGQGGLRTGAYQNPRRIKPTNDGGQGGLSPCGGIGGSAPKVFSIVMSLHACDTATDHALAAAVRLDADLICAVPCCQHELRGQMQPQSLKIFAEHGIIKERIASLATDLIRAKLLEIHGYRAQIIEFTTLEHTQKNLLIRARKTGAKTQKSPELEAFLQEFSFDPTLMRLLGGL